MDMITGKGPSNRHEIFYFGESELAQLSQLEGKGEQNQ
jgi:hypothetical protein